MARKKKICSSGFILKEEKLPPVLYGLEGIMRIFDVSKATASRYKNTILKDAVAQHGNVIVVDVAECLRLFGVAHPEHLIFNDEL